MWTAVLNQAIDAGLRHGLLPAGRSRDTNAVPPSVGATRSPARYEFSGTVQGPRAQVATRRWQFEAR